MPYLLNLVPNDISSQMLLYSLCCEVPLLVDDSLPGHLESNRLLVVLLRGQFLLHALRETSASFITWCLDSGGEAISRIQTE